MARPGIEARSPGEHSSFNVINYYIRLERLSKLSKNVYKKIILIFILIDLYIEL